MGKSAESEMTSADRLSLKRRLLRDPTTPGEQMLPRLLRLRLPRPSSSLPLSIHRPPQLFAKRSPTFRSAARYIQTSSPIRQRYQYVRFNDPYAQSSRGSGGKRGGAPGYWEQLWYRFTPAQRLLLIGFGGGAPIFYVTHLETVEPTGRRRFIFMSRSMEEALGKMVPTSSPDTNLSYLPMKTQGAGECFPGRTDG